MQQMNSAKLSSLSLKQLKEYIKYYNLPANHAIEKNDLITIIFNTRPLTNQNELHYRKLRDKVYKDKLDLYDPEELRQEHVSGFEDIDRSADVIVDNIYQSFKTTLGLFTKPNQDQEQQRREQQQREQQQREQRQREQQQREQQQREQRQREQQQREQRQREQQQQQFRQWHDLRQQQERQQQQTRPSASTYQNNHTSSHTYSTNPYQQPPSNTENRSSNSNNNYNNTNHSNNNSNTNNNNNTNHSDNNASSNASSNKLTLHDIIKSSPAIDLSSLSVRTLKDILKQNHVELNFALEKKELISRVQQLVDDQKKTDLNNQSDVPDDVLCKICLDAEQNCVFLNCQHLVCCHDCGVKLIESKNECPICKEPILQVIRIFRA
ncbi:unnamed protein product [Cunninghamella blakesleeana]